MSMTPDSGTGLKVGGGPPGLKLATSPFTSLPDQEIVAVDAYDIANPGVINSPQEQNVGDSFLDKIKNAITSAVDIKLPGNLSDALGKGKSLLATVKNGTSLIKNVTRGVSKFTTAINQIKNGGIMGSVAGLSNIANMAGVGGAFSLASQARGVVAGISAGGLSGALRAGSAIMGQQGSSLNQLAGNLSAIDRLTSRGMSAISNGGLNGILSTVDGAVGIASSTISSLDRASQIDFTKGFDSVMNHSKISGQSLSQSTLGKVYTAVSDLTLTSSNPDIPRSNSYAGLAAGLVTLGSTNGDNNVFSSLVTKGLDKQSAFTAGTALSALSARSGNLGVLADIASTDIGRQAISSNPRALTTTISNLTPDVSSLSRPLKDSYDQFESVSASTGQSWRTEQRGDITITSASCIAGNSYATDVVAARAAADHFESDRVVASTATSATASDAQRLYLASVLGQTSKQEDATFYGRGEDNDSSEDW